MSIIAVLIGLCSLALSEVALTLTLAVVLDSGPLTYLAVVLDSGALTYLMVALVLLGANGIVVSLANAAIALQRRPDQ